MVARRGATLSENDKELERIKAMLTNPPSHIRNLPPNLFTQDLIRSLAVGRKAVLEMYSPAINHDCVYRLHDFLEDDPNRYPDPEAVKEYQRKVRAVKDGQKEGGKQTQEKATRFAEILLGKNKDLLDRRKPLGNLSVHGIATKIFKEWSTRGIGESNKSVKQIERYINSYLKNNSK